jgi:superfamily I DNA/RNA helicase/mRNA-degrading endonuclease RelE of RelBE toxin-antitoxin system
MSLVRKAVAKVAISDDFLGALDKLPGQVRPRVREMIRRFYQNPAHPSLNYEGIREAREPRLRSIRVTDDYRAIVAHPQGDGTYVLLWVDKHEAAYRWARTHYLSPDDARGLVVVPTSERDAQSPASSMGTAPAPEAGILAGCTDEQLLQTGVPAIFLPALRACATQEALLQALGALQENVAQAVKRLALDDDLGERPLPQREPEQASSAISEPDPIETALSRPESKRRFVIVTSQYELEQALNYPLERWRLFLHPSQQSIVQRRFDGPALVSGGAGTGKTVIGLHRAHYLAAEVYTDPDDHVLLTTFTINLAENLAALIESLCEGDQETRQRIQVKHVHSLAKQLRDLAHESFSIIEEGRATYLMRKAVHAHDTLGFLPSFYRAEWKEVVQERDFSTLEDYLRVDRTGRGRALAQNQRAKIWPVFEAYRQSVADGGWEEWPDVMRRVRQLLASGQICLPYSYRAVIVDEAQDMGTPEMRLLLALVGQGENSLLLLGDTRQQIYARGSYARLLNIPIGRRHVLLQINYRTTEQIRAAASQVAGSASALNGEALGIDEGISLLSGGAPVIRAFETEAEEQQAVAAAIQEAIADIPPEEIAIVARTKGIVAQYHRRLHACGIRGTKLEGHGTTGPGVQLMTIHRAKGLEFRAVFVVGCSANWFPAWYAGDGDEAERTEQEARERRLLYVAMTRARELLWVSGSGAISPLVQGLLS